MSRNEYTCDCTVIHENILAEVKKEMLSEEHFDFVSNFFKIMGDGTRFRILWALDKHEMCVCDIANLLSMTKSAVSHQLATLRKTNLVKCRRDGKTVYYSLSDDHVKTMLEAGVSHIH